ncbi:hypothetical protein A3860_37995 [Niastella vici]|uniref:Serine protease n=1 Tax=Niastella vici TaxID=1703345 RepID=A0A1V9FLM3_9BACT|nr:serine protease [Niastella vici]OQP59249.1 hypothetical protein A3860_37995 [Niastella vici]
MKNLILLMLLVPITSKPQTMKDFRSTISFIYIEDSLHNPIPNGTSFAVGIPSDKIKDRTYSYLITAKHVLQKQDGRIYSSVLIRMNTKDSSRFTFYPLNVSGPHKNVYFHSDPSVDIAVISYAPTRDDYLFTYMGPEYISTKEEFNNLAIEEGTEVFFTGLFVPFTGEHKIYPIVRFGRVSLLPNEKVEWLGFKREMILVETSSFGGNSGAPVYFKIKNSNKTYFTVGGLLNGTYRDAAEIRVIQTSPTPVAIYNNGISGITPVYKIREILFSKELVHEREIADQN